MTTIESLPLTWLPALDALVAPRDDQEAGIYPGTVIDLLRALREDGLKVDFITPPLGFAASRGGQYTAPTFVFSPATVSGGVEVVALAIQDAVGEQRLTRTRMDVAVYVLFEGEARLVYEGMGPAFSVLGAMRASVQGPRRNWRRKSA